jgi:hypothetical protein
MALELPMHEGMDFEGTRTSQPVLEVPRRPSKPPTSGIALWRPEIVLPSTALTTIRPRIVIAEPGLRPEAVRAQIEATQTLLSSTAETQYALGVRAAAAETRAATTDSAGERVAAVIEAYRIQAALDGVLRKTLQRAGALLEELEERGLR